MADAAAAEHANGWLHGSDLEWVCIISIQFCLWLHFCSVVAKRMQGAYFAAFKESLNSKVLWYLRNELSICCGFLTLTKHIYVEYVNLA